MRLSYLLIFIVPILILSSCENANENINAQSSQTTPLAANNNQTKTFKKVRIKIPESCTRNNDSLREIHQMASKAGQYAIATYDCKAIIYNMVELKKAYYAIEDTIIKYNNINANDVLSKSQRGVIGRNDTVEYWDSEDNFFYENRKMIKALIYEIDDLHLKISNNNSEANSMQKNSTQDEPTKYECGYCHKKFNGPYYNGYILGSETDVEKANKAMGHISTFCSKDCYAKWWTVNH